MKRGERHAGWRWGGRAALAAAAAAAVVAGGCAGGPPSGWTPSATESTTDPYGSWVRIDGLDGTWRQEGELLAASRDTIWVFADTAGVRGVALAHVEQVRVYRYHAGAPLAAVAILGVLSTFSHGYFLVISAPVWILTAALVAGVERAAAREDTAPNDWMALRPYCRWPAGWPPGLDWRQVEPKPHRHRDRPKPEHDAWPSGR